MSALDGAACVGKWWLFESLDLIEHQEAAAICAVCPVIEACRERLHSEMTPVGTWAGQLVGTTKSKGGRRPHPREHGTDKGYFQHRYQKEQVRDECVEAHRFTAWLRDRYGASA